MFELKQICKQFESLDPVERTALLAKCSASVVGKLALLDIDGVDPLSALQGFMLGSIVADGQLDEQEYLLIYPLLVRAFGMDFDFASVKQSFKTDKDGKKAVKKYTQDLLKVISQVDEDVTEDIVMLCLCVLSVDGKVTLKERNYIKKLLKQ